MFSFKMENHENYELSVFPTIHPEQQAFFSLLKDNVAQRLFSAWVIMKWG